MRIACFWAEPRSLDRISFRHEHLIDGFRALGHEPVLVTARDLPGRFTGPVRLVDELTELATPELWRTSGFDLAVGVTWLRKSDVLRAIAAAGIARIAIADSDGQIGYAAHPRASWERIAHAPGGARALLRGLRYFARRYRASRARTDREELDFVASAEASTAIAFASDAAIACFRRFLSLHGKEALATRAFAAPFPVPAAFCSAPIGAREDLVVAIGRWDDPQKNAPLLAEALRSYLDEASSTRVEIFGAGSEAAFAELASSQRRALPHGVREPEIVRAALARARSLVLSSRWETGPHVAGEALALGTTIVSTPLPTVEGLIDGGRFGTLARDRSAGALAAALALEREAWERGERDPSAIAAHWRARLAPAGYCARLLSSLAR